MRKTTIIVKCMMFAALALLLGACSTSKEARSVETRGILFDPAILQKGEGDQALYRYQNAKISMNNYQKVMITPVKFAKPAKATAEELADLQKLANNFNQYLLNELSKDYSVVPSPGAGVLKVETAIYEADKSRPGMDFISTVMPIGLAVSIVKDVATGKPLNVGEISGEMKITDAGTGELIGAAVDRRVGGKSFSGMFTSWDDANKAMEYWAKKLRYALCIDRGNPSCEKP